MSIEQLQSDLAEIKRALPSSAMVTTEELLGYIKHNLLPFIESHVTETAEIDEAVGQLVDHEADILHEETAAEFHTLLELCRAVTKELAERMGNDARLAKMVKDTRAAIARCDEILGEITVADADSDADDADPGSADPDPHRADPTGAAP